MAENISAKLEVGEGIVWNKLVLIVSLRVLATNRKNSLLEIHYKLEILV